MKTRIFALFLATLLAAVFFAGCIGGSEPKTTMPLPDDGSPDAEAIATHSGLQVVACGYTGAPKPYFYIDVKNWGSEEVDCAFVVKDSSGRTVHGGDSCSDNAVPGETVRWDMETISDDIIDMNLRLFYSAPGSGSLDTYSEEFVIRKNADGYYCESA